MAKRDAKTGTRRVRLPMMDERSVLVRSMMAVLAQAYRAAADADAAWLTSMQLCAAVGYSGGGLNKRLGGPLRHGMLECISRGPGRNRAAHWRITPYGLSSLDAALRVHAAQAEPAAVVVAKALPAKTKTKPKTMTLPGLKGKRLKVTDELPAEMAEERAHRQHLRAWQPLPRSTAARAISALSALGPGHVLESCHLAAAIGLDDPRDVDQALAPAVDACRVRRYPSPRDVRRHCYAIVRELDVVGGAAA